MLQFFIEVCSLTCLLIWRLSNILNTSCSDSQSQASGSRFLSCKFQVSTPQTPSCSSTSPCYDWKLHCSFAESQPPITTKWLFSCISTTPKATSQEFPVEWDIFCWRMSLRSMHSECVTVDVTRQAKPLVFK